MPERAALQNLVLEAFVMAQRQREPEAAEHLLLALEALDRRCGAGDPIPQRHLREAYGTLIRSSGR